MNKKRVDGQEEIVSVLTILLIAHDDIQDEENGDDNQKVERLFQENKKRVDKVSQTSEPFI